MVRHAVRVLAVVLLAAAHAACSGLPARSPTLAIVGGAIVDPDASAQPRRATVLVRGGRVVAVDADLVPPKGARLIDAQGAFLVPALWDMHAHLAALTPVGDAPERYVGHGVLAIRDMGGDLDLLLSLRRELRTRARISPELLIAGPSLNGQRFAAFQRAVRNDAEARAAVRELAAAGVDFIKTHRATSREAFVALLDESRRQGLHVSGHVPLAVSWIEAAEAGMRSMEHVQTLLENELSDVRDPAPDIGTAVRRIDGERGDAVFAALARHGTFFDPTLIHYEETLDDKPEVAARRTELYGHLKRYVGRAHRAGVAILAGTDVLERHGDLLLTEMERLVECGLTPREALRAATTHPARLLGRPDLGAIVPGATASLLIVRGDPTVDVRNLRQLDTVLLEGRVIDAATLKRLRTGASTPSAVAPHR